MRRNEVQGLAVPAVDIPKLGLTDADYRATKSLLFLPPAPEAKSDSYAAQSTHSITMNI
jgi:hypothetical protein